MSALIEAGRAVAVFDRCRPSLCNLLRGVRAESVALLVLALACELPVLAIRSVVLYLGMGLLVWSQGAHLGPFESELALILPFAWPALALLVPFPSGWWWRHSEGGRQPSERELIAYQDSIETLQASSSAPLRLPAGWFVLDSPYPDAAVCGDTLMLSRTLIESEHLPAVLAHELGHLAGGDGRLTATINRLLILRRPKQSTAIREQARGLPQRPYWLHAGGDGDAWFWETLLMLAFWVLVLGIFALRFARGGFGLRLTAPVWGSYWRAREYRADEHAARLGQAEELADFLEAHALIHDQPIPFVWLTEHTHPPTELRIGRLRAHAERENQIPLLDQGR